MLPIPCGHVRFYQQHADARLEQHLVRRGYRRSEEVALLADFATGPAPDHADVTVELRPVETADDWRRKLELHGAITKGPDGHTSPAELWVELERRKSAAGHVPAGRQVEWYKSFGKETAS